LAYSISFSVKIYPFLYVILKQLGYRVAVGNAWLVFSKTLFKMQVGNSSVIYLHF